MVDMKKIFYFYLIVSQHVMIGFLVQFYFFNTNGIDRAYFIYFFNKILIYLYITKSWSVAFITTELLLHHLIAKSFAT